MSMDEVTPGLWIGDLASALDVEKLKTHGIYSILSAMRGRLTIKETFIKHQVLLDDTEDTDILQHLLPSIHFIEAELNKGRGILVHCHAGVSRSATVVAAFLMYSKNLDREAALEMIRNVRPSIEPNEGFLRQLEIFHKSQFKISRRDKSTRLYYMERTLDEVMNGDGSLPETNMFAKFPHTPSDSTPNTPGQPRRRIRCKMCRHELASREHMLDHGQLGPATPGVMTPVASRRPSFTARSIQGGANGTVEPRPHRPSHGLLSDTLSMSSIGAESSGSSGHIPTSRRSSGDKPSLQNVPEVPHAEGRLHSTSALESDDEDPLSAPEMTTSPVNIADDSVTISHETAKIIGRRMSDAVLSPLSESKESPLDTLEKARRISSDSQSPLPSHQKALTTTFISPADLSAELYSNPKLAALRAPHNASPLGTGVTAMQPLSKVHHQSAPILANPKCSGYFVEPMNWMEPFLSSGQLSGKIVCPNTKCGAKLGSYDWAARPDVPQNGHQPPLLILLHGFPELAYSWRKVIIPLSAAGYHVVAPDQRGYGHTRRRGTQKEHDKFTYTDDLAPFRMLNLANDIVSLVYALGYTSAAAVIGHDYGSSVAGHCALIRPDIFKSVVLMSAPYTGAPAPSIPLTSPINALSEGLASLTPPRKHYVAYYSTPEANADMIDPPHGLRAFLRAYYHVKSGDWANNVPHSLPSLSAVAFAQLPLYYVMNLNETMPQTVARDAPSAAEVADNAWLTEAELSVYVAVYAETGFQGGLNRYRCATDVKWAEDLRVFQGKKIEVPAMFLSGKSDWGIYQIPGAMEKMQTETCARMRADDFVLVDGAGHWVQQEAPGEVVKHLFRFFKQDIVYH
ncbi:hypothetical protein C0991_010354 [Blastosporella zonata]|nr:hypothetical protein C0991_010354 [Blastosporella zonata]